MARSIQSSFTLYTPLQPLLFSNDDQGIFFQVDDENMKKFLPHDTIHAGREILI